MKIILKAIILTIAIFIFSSAISLYFENAYLWFSGFLVGYGVSRITWDLVFKEKKK